MHFDGIDDIRSNTTAVLKAIPHNHFPNCFDVWTRRWHWCIASQVSILKETTVVFSMEICSTFSAMRSQILLSDHLCMYVFIYVCVRMYVCMYVCMCMYGCMHACTYICKVYTVYVLCICVCVLCIYDVRTYVSMYVYMCVGPGRISIIAAYEGCQFSSTQL
jgi:hypothetical protein